VAANPELAEAVQARLGGRFAGRYAGVTQHTPASSIVEAARAAGEAGADLLVSLGGGSAVDAAKAVAFSLATGLDLSDPEALGQAARVSLDELVVLPQLAIPTTLSVAELSYSAGFSASGSREKVGVRGQRLMPAAVFYDAELAVHTPLQLWLTTGLRAVDHAVEGLYSAGSHPYSDTLALEGLRRLKAGLLASHDDPGSVEARTEAQLGAWFSYALPFPSMTGLSHTLGKRLGSRHDIPHGVTSCLLLPHVMRYLAPRTSEAQARIAAALGVETAGLSPAQAAGAAADAVEDLIVRLGLPRHLRDYGLSEADLVDAIAPIATESDPASELLEILHRAS
jgi:alcohol dehydrogenase